MDIHPYVIQSRSEFGSKSYMFMGNEEIILLTNLFQHLIPAEILSEWKIELYYHIYGEISKSMQGTK